MSLEKDIKNAKKLYEVLKQLQGNHRNEYTTFIREAFDKVYLLLHQDPTLFEHTSIDELAKICSQNVVEVAEEMLEKQLCRGLSGAMKLGDGITVLICRGTTNLVNDKITMSSPITETTRFDLASITKLFTSIQLLKNQEMGKLDLNQTLKEYNPEFKLNVPMKEILTFNYDIKTNGRINEVASTEEEALKMIQHMKIEEVNTHLYSDMGYIAVNKANPDHVEEFKKYFNDEMGLQYTGYEIDEKDIVTGGTLDHLRCVHDPKARIIHHAGSAGVFSTSLDLVKLYDALRDGFLSVESLKEMIDPTLDPKYITEDMMYLLDENGDLKLDSKGNKIPITRGMEYRWHELGFAHSEVAPSESDHAFSATGFTGTWMTIDPVDYTDPKTWMTANILTNPISSSETGQKPAGYVWNLDELKEQELKTLYSLLALQKIYENIYHQEMDVKDKIIKL